MIKLFKCLGQSSLAVILSISLMVPITLKPLATVANTRPATSLNLKNASLRSLINTVSKATGKNFLIDPRVRGSVTVVISTPLDSQALYQVFLSILNVHGFIAVEGQHLTKILPANLSKTSSAYVSNSNPDSLITTVIPITYIDAQQIIPVLRPFVSPNSFLSAYAPTNVLIIHDTKANLNRLRRLIAAADKPLNQDFELVEVKHANAAELAKILTTFLTQEKTTPAPQKIQIAADPRTNRIVVKADVEQRLKIRTLVNELDIADSQGNTTVVYLRYAEAKKIVPILKAIVGNASAKEGAPINSQIMIQAEDSVNAIIMSAPQTVQAEIRSVIRQLDIRRAQVLIEAIIAEVSSGDSSQFGVQWASNARQTIDNQQVPIVGGVNFDGSIPSVIANPTAAASNFPTGLALAVGELTDESQLQGWAALINLVKSDSQVNLLSAPSIVTLDNVEASFLVGQEVPFITNTQLSDNNTNPFQNFERKNVGLSLKVKPQINEGDAIKLDIKKEVSNILASTQAADTVTSKRTLDTSVLVDDGKIVVLGGLMDESDRGGQFKVPLLGDIPLLGWLFRYETSNTSKRNLMVFIKPEIIRDNQALNQISLGKYNSLRLSRDELHQSKEINLNIYDEFLAEKKPEADTNPAQFIE